MVEDKKENNEVVNDTTKESPVQLSDKKPIDNVQPEVNNIEENKKVDANIQEVPPVVESPIVTDNVVSTPLGEIKEPKKKAKKGVIVATILIVAVALGLGTLGVFKLMEFLNQPKTLFYSVVESAYSDFVSAMNGIKGNEIYSSYLSNTLEYDGQIKLSIDGNEVDETSELLNNITLNTNAKIDRNNNFMSVDLKAMIGEEEKLGLQLVDQDFKYYIKVPQLFEKFISIDMEHVNADSFDVENNVFLGDIIKRELLNILDDDRFESVDESLTINGQVINCKKSSYTFKGSEIKTFIDNVITSIKNNNNVYKYLQDITGMDSNELDKVLNEFKTDLKIPDDKEYTILAYTEAGTDEAVRLELDFKETIEDKEEDVKIAYSKDLDYMSLDCTEGSDVSSIELKGSFDSTFTMTIKEPETIITYAGRNNNGNMDAAIKVTDVKSNTEVTSGKITSSTKKESDGSYTVSTTLDITSDGTTMNLAIDGSIRTGVKIEKVDTSNAVKLDELTEEETNEILMKLMALFAPSTPEGTVVPPIEPGNNI